ncbi:MAG TPA: DUF2721 domain-containing protein [Myxococcaceae bacterium]|nr:DUF2721 domain-containing protein [Myxococcaceae bacterium]
MARESRARNERQMNFPSLMALAATFDLLPPARSLNDVTEVIRLAVAPVFLLTAIGTILSVLSARLGRIIDRARVLSDRLQGMDARAQQAARAEMRVLHRRRRLINVAITFGTVSALLVCLLIAGAFIAVYFSFDASLLISALFVLSLGSLVVALLFFLREILLAVRSTPIDPH